MLPQGLNLGWELDPFGLIIFTARDQSQLSLSVVILLLKTIVLRAFSHEKDAGAVCSHKFCQGWEGVLSRTTSGSIPRVSMSTWITPFRMYLGKYSTHTVIS